MLGSRPLCRGIYWSKVNKIYSRGCIESATVSYMHLFSLLLPIHTYYIFVFHVRTAHVSCVHLAWGTIQLPACVARLLQLPTYK